MGTAIAQIDAFTDRAFGGNPAAVCVLSGPADETWMQNVAREMNLSETAFLHPEGDGLRLRWFTPEVEVDLCGHATLASAHLLWETGVLQPYEQARFYTRSGLLTARQAGGVIEMDFPATPCAPAEPPPALLAALGVRASFVGRTCFDYLVEVSDEDTVRQLKPDFGTLATIETRGVMVTARALGGYDFVSRFFAPAVGIAEDPVTGSAHCCLGPFWSDRLNKSQLVGHQASLRGGIVYVTMAGDRVRLAGRAVTVLKGELLA